MGVRPHLWPGLAQFYLGVFLNHGWIGGISYIALVVLTIAVGFRAIFVPTPWRDAMIATFAAYVGLALESFIVDTDHWRLYYLLVGMIWGMFAATVNFTRNKEAAELPDSLLAYSLIRRFGVGT